MVKQERLIPCEISRTSGKSSALVPVPVEQRVGGLNNGSRSRPKVSLPVQSLVNRSAKPFELSVDSKACH